MAKVDGDDVELTTEDAALIKGMLSRGDKQHHIAAYFGVDSRAVSHIATGKTFGGIKAAEDTTLPPPGPYRPDSAYVGLFQRMTKVNSLWNARRMKDAKALLEATLKSPMLPIERNSVEESLDDLFRDEFGILTDLN